MNLDDDYANAAYIANADAFPSMWEKKAKAFRAETDAREALPYGAGTRHKFDLVLPSGVPVGLFVFVHGGYWLRFDRSYWTHLARGAVDRGWAVAMPSYSLAPQARISEITRQVARAIDVAAGEVDGPIVLAGHSAGGHLVARMACPGVLPDAAADRLQQIVPISPVADLRPLMQTSMNSELKLDDAECLAESPSLLKPRTGVPVTVWVGARERPAFLDQARWLSEAWGCDRFVAGEKHHFDVIDVLENPNSALCRMLFPN
ncbi:alpha/beta hydrolase [Shimia sp. W99]